MSVAFFSCDDEDDTTLVNEEETENKEKTIPQNIEQYQLVDEGLKDYFKEHFIIGAAIEPASLDREEEVELIKRHFGSLTAENVMKWSSLQPTEGNYRWQNADRIVEFARENNMKVRGHTLVWHNQTPDWVFNNDNQTASKEVVLQRMRNHITEVMTRYKNDVYAWDVVNEVIGDGNNQYRQNSDWYKICGEDFILEAFRTAREVNPEAKLFYNDYSATQPTKRDKIYNLLKKLKNEDLIDGVGLQGHWNIDAPSNQRITDAIDKYASLDIEIHITELDVSIYRNNDEQEMLYSHRETDHVLAYARFFRRFRNLSEHITNVTFWGVADNHTWLDNFPVSGRKNYPFLFDEKYEPKAPYFTIIDF